MIANNGFKAKTVSIDAHSYVQLQLEKEVYSKKTLEKKMETQQYENATLKSALNASQQSKQSIADKNLQLIAQLEQFKQQSMNEKEINKKTIQDLKQKLKETQEEARNQSSSSKSLGANSLAIENAASRFNVVNQSLKDAKWHLQIEKGKVTKLDDEIRELKAELLKDQGGDLHKIKYKEESKQLIDEIARLREELENQHKAHELELKLSYDKMLAMQTEWKRKEDDIQSKISKAKARSQIEITKLRHDLEEAQSTNEGKLLTVLKADKETWESASNSYKGRIVVLVDALDEQVRRCKDLEDELALTKEVLRKSTGLRHVELENLTKDMRRKDEAGRLQFRKKLKKMKSREENNFAQDDLNKNSSNSRNISSTMKENTAENEETVPRQKFPLGDASKFKVGPSNSAKILSTIKAGPTEKEETIAHNISFVDDASKVTLGSTNKDKLLVRTKEDEKRKENSSIFYNKQQIAMLVHALDEKVCRCKMLEDDLLRSQEALWNFVKSFLFSFFFILSMSALAYFGEIEFIIST